MNIKRKNPTKDAKIFQLDDILKVISQDLACSEAVFVWWSDHILPNVCGRDAFWNSMQHYHSTICDHTHTVDKKVRWHITPALEAFALLTIESNRAKWQEMAKIKAANLPLKTKFVPKKANATANDGKILHETHNNAVFDGEYTQAKSGQRPLGGYTKEGVKLHAKWKKAATKGRDLGSAEDLESSILDALQTTMGIAARTYEEHCKNHGEKITAVQREADEEEDLDVVSDSDEEEEE